MAQEEQDTNPAVERSSPAGKTETATSVPKIIAADRLSDSLIIEFDDGRCGRYPTLLLYGILQYTTSTEEAGPRPAGI